MKTILELRVYDRPGVLDRIVSLIRRRGFNIVSLTAGDVGESTTQITILLQGRGPGIDTLGEYLAEMDAVRTWRQLSDDDGLLREMLLYRVSEADTQAQGRVLEARGGFRWCEVTGTPQEIDALAAALHARNIACVRSGPLTFPTYSDQKESPSHAE